MKNTKAKKNNVNFPSKSGVKRNKLKRGIFVTGIILLALLVFLLFFNFGSFESPKKEELFKVKDECSLVMGNVIHNIRDSGDCLVKCKNECQIRKMTFIREEFQAKNNSCHACDCYCN